MLHWRNNAPKMPVIRRAGESDAPAVVEVLRRAFAEYRPLYTERGFSATTPDLEQILSRMQEGPVWVAEEAACIAGTVSAILRGSECYVRGMAVSPESGGRGIGRLLLRAVEEFALAAGARSSTLSTTPFLTHAIHLYESCGYRRTHSGPHDLYGTPLFTMTKDLS
jgi:ribosomal protein S18 acetylase RimI-like enzyme